MLHNIYFDADANNGGVTPPAQPVTPPSTPSQPQGKTFTQDELNAIIAKELSKHESKSIQKQKEIEEAERLKSMTAEQKKDEEFRRIQEKLAAFERNTLVAEMKAQLAEQGLPIEFASIIPVGNAEEAKVVIDALTKQKQSYETIIAGLNEKLKNADMRGTPPKSANQGGGTTNPLPTVI